MTYPTNYKKPPIGPDGMPEWWPVFEAEDMCKDTLHNGRRHCALGHLSAMELNNAARYTFCEAYKDSNGHAFVGRYNDSLPSHQARADAMNRTVRALGFTNVEDE